MKNLLWHAKKNLKSSNANSTIVRHNYNISKNTHDYMVQCQTLDMPNSAFWQMLDRQTVDRQFFETT